MAKTDKRTIHSDEENRYVNIVTDPKICHGKPTFRGTRVLVSDVLDQVSNGVAWETIIEEWNGSITRDAISEALQLIGQSLAAPNF